LRLLVIETASPILSVALFENGALIGHDHRLVGRGHAEHLLPAIAALPGGGRADTILVGCGPGSFTGIRIGIAAARALAFGWGAELTGYDTLALIAAQARRLSGTSDIAVAVDGGHGEVFVATAPLSARSMLPADAAASLTGPTIAGPRAAELVALRGWGTAITAEADAREIAALDPAARLSHAHPLYGRAPDAKPSAVPA
jgi:tRNA threonylcarbamoyladenosine biosynthesis protein TsaB